jgi:alkylation response protein AidB-like acyl-CoA dehydrogenase
MAANPREISDMESTVLEAVRALEPQIRAASSAIEDERRLPPALARSLMEAGVFRMGVPRTYGGPELDPMAQVRVVEELSRIEGAVGWLSMISSAGSFLAAFLKPEPAQRLFGGVESVLAGQLRPPQRADLADGGYRVSGTFHFASGSGHASVMTCGCTIYENGRPRLTSRGHPDIRVMLVPTVKTRIVDVWDTTGMRGTGSNDFIVDNVFVPFDDCPNLGAGPAYCAAPLYSWPALFLVSHAGVPLGLARSALDFVEELTTRKELMPGRPMREDGQVQETIAAAEASVEAARCYVYRTLEDLWATLSAGEKPSPRQRAHYRLMMTHAHQTAKQVIGTLYDLAATSAIFRSSPLERNMRDILTSSQHRVVHPKMYRPAGRLILGLDPEEIFF